MLFTETYHVSWIITHSLQGQSHTVPILPDRSLFDLLEEWEYKKWDCNYMNWETVICSLNLLAGHDSIILGVEGLNCYCFGVSHPHYVWFLCCLSLNCSFDVNQVGNFHLLQRLDGPPLIGVSLVLSLLTLEKLQHRICNADLLWVTRLCI